MKGRTIAWGKPMKHKINITDLDHRRTRFHTALIVLTVAPIPPIPGVRTLNDPAFLQWREAFHALWTRLHLDAPTGPMLGHPGVQGMVMILLVRKDRHKTWQVMGGDVAEQERGRHPIIKTRTGNEDSQHQTQRTDHQMPLTPFDFLAPSYPRAGPPTSVVLTDWLSMHAALGVGSRPAATRVRSRKACTILAHVPSSRHCAK